MEIIKETRTVEEIKGYKAYDGTVFKDKEECEKYENTANAIIINRFKQLVIKELEGCVITQWGDSFAACGCDEDWYYALVEIKNENDLTIAQMYQKITGYSKHGFTEDMIGKRVIVSIGTGIYPRPTEGSQCCYDNCYVYGTIEDQVKLYEEKLRKLEEVDEY